MAKKVKRRGRPRVLVVVALLGGLTAGAADGTYGQLTRQPATLAALGVATLRASRRVRQ